jgi:hypothetical protein
LIAIIFGFLILGSLEEQAGGEDEEEASTYPFYYLSRQKNLFLLVEMVLSLFSHFSNLESFLSSLVLDHVWRMNCIPSS